MHEFKCLCLKLNRAEPHEVTRALAGGPDPWTMDHSRATDLHQDRVANIRTRAEFAQISKDRIAKVRLRV